MEHLFSSYTLGSLTLPNRIVMAPMTRSRALGNIPNDLMANYYAQRASAGLIITEGTAPSPSGLGYPRIPGIFANDQKNGWQLVTTAVHENGGRIFLQLMHTGRVSHPENLQEDTLPLAPSSVALKTTRMWVDGAGLMEIPSPKEMNKEEIQRTISDHITAAKNAIDAGFDGVEIHGANGYLIKQFLNPHINNRTDEYGGSVENRARFALEITQGIAEAIGAEKVGIRISPFSEFNETPQYEGTAEAYHYLVKKLDALHIAYLHVIDPQAKGYPNELSIALRNVFKNTLILSGGYTAEKAAAVIADDLADLVSFGRPFIPNPDLVDRFRNDLPLNQPKSDLFYTAGAEGYADYPSYSEVPVAR